MVWKVLSILAAGCLGASCYFAWSNQKDLAAERDRESFAKANLKQAEESKKQADEALVAKKTALETVQKELAAAKDETIKLTSLVQEKEVSHGVIKGNLEQTTQQVTAVEKQIEDAGDIEKLIAQIEKLKKDQADAEAAAANQTQRLAAAQEAYKNLVDSTAKLRETEAQGRRGIIAPDFTARVAQYFPEWDVAVLSKGNSGGVIANADLEVKRGKNVIAKLKVKNVEQYGAVAEVIPGSIAEGQAILTGDTVVAAATQASAEKAAAPAPAAEAATPAASLAAPAAAPMSSDPFGAAPAPAAAPAAAPMASDPFGAAPAPDASPAAAPMASDPFGAAPAPAGTADKPSTADPFGAAPAKP